MYAFKKIANNPEFSDEKKIKKLDQLVKLSEFLANEFDDSDADYKNYYFQYLRMQETEKFHGYNIPKLDLLLNYGFITLEKIVNVTKEEILNWNAISPKNPENIVTAQDRLKIQ